MFNGAEQSSIRVLVVDDTRLHTQLLADALGRDKAFEVIGSDPQELGSRKDFHEIDVLLLSADLEERVGHGYEMLREIRKEHSSVCAVILLTSSKDESVLEAFRAGARGILSRQASIEMLSKCLLRVHQGQIWANTHQMIVLVRSLAPSSSLPTVRTNRMEQLSKRELEVVDKVVEGLTNREVADRLGLSQHTVKNYLFKVFEKLEISTRTELLSLVLRRMPEEKTVQIYSWEDRSANSLPDGLAFSKCELAAAAGILTAQLELAQFHWSRRASSKHASKAYQWYLIAKEQLVQSIEQAATLMTTQELLDAEKSVAECLDSQTAPLAPSVVSLPLTINGSAQKRAPRCGV